MQIRNKLLDVIFKLFLGGILEIVKGPHLQRASICFVHLKS